MTARELLERLQLLGETERIEAKAGSEVGKSIMETVCAFANEPGMGDGWLLLAVVRDEMALFPGYSVEGIEQPEWCRRSTRHCTRSATAGFERIRHRASS